MLQGKTDPGIRNQIFQPIYQNADGYYALDVDFVTANVMIKCDAAWTSEVYDNFNQYVKGWMSQFKIPLNALLVLGKLQSSTTGYGIQAIPITDVR